MDEATFQHDQDSGSELVNMGDGISQSPRAALEAQIRALPWKEQLRVRVQIARFRLLGAGATGIAMASEFSEITDIIKEFFPIIVLFSLLGLVLAMIQFGPQRRQG